MSHNRLLLFLVYLYILGADGVLLSVTYLVQYNPYFAHKSMNSKPHSNIDRKPVKVTSRRQIDDGLNSNSFKFIKK